MSKVLPATCEAGQVTCEGIDIDATILSEGQGASSGSLILDHDRAFYVASNATDIKDALDATVDALEKIGSMLTSIGAGMTGATTAPPPTLAADVTELNALATTLDTLKGNLK